jgi:hypothetical protein
MTEPLAEVENQIIGRVAVASEQELLAIEGRLKSLLSCVERDWQETARSRTGGLPARRLVCVIPPQAKPPGWDSREDVPNTFEMQLHIDPESVVAPSVSMLPAGDTASDDAASKPSNATSWLLEAVRQVPAMKYAVAAVGVVAAVAISLGLVLGSYTVAILGSVAIFSAMLLLRLYAVAQPAEVAFDPSLPIKVLVWAVVIAFVVVLGIGVVKLGIELFHPASPATPHNTSPTSNTTSPPGSAQSPKAPALLGLTVDTDRVSCSFSTPWPADQAVGHADVIDRESTYVTKTKVLL